MTPLPHSSSCDRPAAVRLLRGVYWVSAYVLLAVFPLVVLLAGEIPKGGGMGWDFAMALGFGGLAILGLQSVLTARFRRATAPFGIDVIYYFHRWAAVGGFALIVAHYAILRIGYRAAVGPVNPLAAPWPMTAGRLALVLFALLIVSSLWRKALRIDYDRWRTGHAIMAVLAVGLAVAHIQGVGYYTQAVWKGAVWVGYSALWVLTVAYVRVARPLSLLRSPYRVTEVHRERGRAWTLTLAPERAAALRFRPGQFAWLSLGTSPFRAREHPFSLSGSAEDRGALRFTIKELGDFTNLIGRVKVGEIAYVDGPHGVFTTDYHARAPGFVFVAGGVGIAPIMSILRTLADRGERRPLRLVYGNRCWENVVFREELAQLRTRLPLEVVHVLQEPPPDWTGLRGVLGPAELAEAIPAAAPGTVFFLCGPKPMSDSVQRRLRAAGVPMNRIHCELFEMA
ncbi:MAG: ferric reductase-like transmembrane domain-containing protein [Verrucomicrobia bacterium]|nr:ferric reductase-like transmembrane domain-containing protein [Verrucomicrobiota bacterium]